MGYRICKREGATHQENKRQDTKSTSPITDIALSYNVWSQIIMHVFLLHIPLVTILDHIKNAFGWGGHFGALFSVPDKDLVA